MAPLYRCVWRYLTEYVPEPKIILLFTGYLSIDDSMVVPCEAVVKNRNNCDSCHYDDDLNRFLLLSNNSLRLVITWCNYRYRKLIGSSLTLNMTLLLTTNLIRFDLDVTLSMILHAVVAEYILNCLMSSFGLWLKGKRIIGRLQLCLDFDSDCIFAVDYDVLTVTSER